MTIHPFHIRGKGEIIELETILVTGGAGFIGSNFIRFVLSNFKEYQVINLDFLTYAGNLSNLKDVETDKKYKFIFGDISDKKIFERLPKNIDYIINFAAESHVDRSIQEAGIFLKTNVLGTLNLLEHARSISIKKFIQVSTDEVYGSLDETGKFSETTNLSPNNPYSASKASADLFVNSYHKTHEVPANITRCSNNYGPYQFPEKLIPLTIMRALNDQEIPVYGDGTNIRDWIHVEDHARGIMTVLQKGKIGEIYNIGGGNEIQNINLVKSILSQLNKPFDLISFVEDRKGHDKRYAIDFRKIHEKLSWSPKIDFKKGLENTVQWYKNNIDWIRNIQDGSYLKIREQFFKG